MSFTDYISIFIACYNIINKPVINGMGFIDVLVIIFMIYNIVKWLIYLATNGEYQPKELNYEVNQIKTDSGKFIKATRYTNGYTKLDTWQNDGEGGYHLEHSEFYD